MSRFLSKTLIRTTSTVSLIRRLSTHSESICNVDPSLTEPDALMVKKIEDAIHSFIVKRSKPDWLPFVPGSSYWVPPRRASYGVAEIVSKISNELTEEEYLAVTSIQGWPSSDFYLNNADAHSHPDVADTEALSTKTSSQEDDS